VQARSIEPVRAVMPLAKRPTLDAGVATRNRVIRVAAHVKHLLIRNIHDKPTGCSADPTVGEPLIHVAERSLQPPLSCGVTNERNASEHRNEARGLVLGFIGVLCFSVSLPVTRVAVREFGVIFVSFGRAVIAALLAIVVIVATRTPVPSRRFWPRIAIVIGGVVVGFPAFTGLALQRAPAGHGSLVVGLLPAATAGLSVLRTGDRPSGRYWFFAAIGAGAIAVLSIVRGTRDIAIGDMYLLAAVLAAAIGYTEGALLAREFGGWQTISWAVVGALPITLPLTLIGLGPVGFHEPMTAWFSLAYLGAVSMFLGFFAWYAGLALGGIARVSQVQLLQPILSLVWATLFLHEHLDLLIVVVAIVILLSVFGSRRSAVRMAS
jgi:drug/metabolite transporter (DMT)-like permease